MTVDEQQRAAKEFAEYWAGKGYEKGESQKFWLSLLRDVYGVDHPEKFISFEDQVHLDHTSFIDGYIPSTKVLIEQKGLNKNLNAPIKQSDGTLLTPFQQAKRYIVELPVSQHPKWVVTCNFGEFNVYDMEKPGGDPEIIKLVDLEKEYYRLDFLTKTGNEHLKREMEVSIAAGDIVGLLYNAFAKQYADPTSEKSMKSLNVLCVRLVFCLYAEDAGIFGRHGMFHDYLAESDVRHMRKDLIELFRILDTKPEDRDPYLKNDNPALAEFPYVNGGLFADENIEIPSFTEEIRELLLNKASDDFDWSEISPTIFGAVFESTLNPETRRSGGMHYTSIENIHKVIDPLFLDDLKKEFAEISAGTVVRTKEQKLKDFQTKLASLEFLDPAAGSGNFLTESYLSLRRLENLVIKEILGLEKGQFYGQGSFVLDGMANPIQVSIQQFHGIEINDFAVTVAKTALWIAESQMMKETEEIVLMHLDFLPLKTNANIVEGNALRIDWEDVVSKEKLSFIMGNPPFIGYSLQSKEQKSDILSIYVDEKGKPYKTAGKIDYVAGWYYKASKLMQGTEIKTAFVSTNSITQGEQVAGVWKPLYEQFGIHIDFAYRTFIWDSEANLKAHVHCVIVGFSCNSKTEERILFDGNSWKNVGEINPYLMSACVTFVEPRKDAICECPDMSKGFQATDNGFLILDEKERADLLRKEPEAEKWIRPYSMGVEFINKIPRYCLWLKNIKPNELRALTEIKKRVEACREWRSQATPSGDAFKLKDTPHLFRPCKQFKDTKYIAIPLVSSSQRRYMPMGFIDNGMIPGNNLFSVFDASLYHFAILQSNIHMAWIRAIGGRLKSDWRYSKDIVYNNFPWPTPTEAQHQKIEKTGQAILDARTLYPDSSLADLYDELTMPPELRKAHQANDRAVMEAYGFVKGTPAFSSEAACVAELMKMYQAKVEEIEKAK